MRGAYRLQIVTLRAEMVVDHIEKDHEPAGMRVVDQHAQIVGPPISAVRSIEQDAVIAPVSPAGEVGDRHQFDRGESGVTQVIELVDGRAERAAGRERADVKLQDRRMLPGPASPFVCPPLELIVIDDFARPEHIVRLEVRGRIGTSSSPSMRNL